MDVADLADLESIRFLKHRYMRCVDQKHYEELADCFAEDANTAYEGGMYSYQGREAILDFLRTMDRPTLLTCHRVTQPEIELLSPTTARGIWALEETCHDLESKESWHAAAFYTDEYVKIDGKWKIKSTGYKRTYEDGRDYEDGTRIKAYPQDPS